MSTELDEFHLELLQEISIAAAVGSKFLEDAFFETITDYLTIAGELPTADRAFFEQKGKGIRIDGYGGDPRASDNILSLIVCDFSQNPSVSTMTQTDLTAALKRPVNFLAKAGDAKFRNALEETSPGFGVAEMIDALWDEIDRVRIFLLTDKALSTRIDEVKGQDIAGKPVTFNVWDLRRIQRYANSRRDQEDIEIDLLKEYGFALPVLPAHLHGAGYEAYLAVMPGDQLAQIYERWNTRLLEQNVRVFLQGVGKVNRSIRSTLDNSPQMFFAYNNGITATAEHVEFTDNARTAIRTLRNFQIVNGGQTTASIHAAWKTGKADLSKVFVQMKLSVVDSETAEVIVPDISRYANSQNKVNDADFFSNHPFHVRIEEFSRRILAPASDGSLTSTKWFYERSRGQYKDAKARLSTAARKKFEAEMPPKQIFTKTDLAKYMNVWRQLPHEVSKGAQKNFLEFAKYIGSEWSRNQDQFNELFFRESVAKAIVFQETERLVSKQPWYEGGYRANIVAYAIAKIAHDVANMGAVVDLEGIWKRQGVPSSMADALVTSAAAVHEVLVNPPSTHKNVTEWAKQQACWNRVANLTVDWPQGWLVTLVGKSESRERERAAQKDQVLLNGIEAQTAVYKAGGALWAEIREWGLENKILSPREADVLAVAAAIPNKLPTEKQSLIALEALKRLQNEGCMLGKGIL
jgi:hypothetical protein